MPVGGSRRDAATRRARDEAGLDEEGFVEVLEAVHALAHGDREGLRPDRATGVFLDDGAQDVAVEPLEPEDVYLEAVQAPAHDGPRYPALPLDLGEIPHPPQQPVRDPQIGRAHV